MPNKFLYDVVSNLIAQNPDFRKTEVIVPNVRTGIFFRKAFCSMTTQVTWLPKITTIQDLFYANSSLIVADNLRLISMLYRVFTQIMGGNEPFDRFYYWGEILLSDFNDIDKYVVDPQKLFKNMRDIKEVDATFRGYSDDEIEVIKRFWANINVETINEHKERFLRLWEHIPEIYRSFKDCLTNEGIAFQGMLYRDVIDRLTLQLPADTYVIVGFSALNTCETRLFEHIKQERNARFYFDADHYYLDNDRHEAGLFLRRLENKFKSSDGVGIVDNITAGDCKIEVFAVPSPISQVKYASTLLDSWLQEFDNQHVTTPDDEKTLLRKQFIENTAVVLGDETLLQPLLASISDSFPDVNVSMGAPVKNSAAFALITHLIDLQRKTMTLNKKTLFHYSTVIPVLKHKFIQCIGAQNADSQTISEIENRIVADKKVYFSFADYAIPDVALDAVFDVIFSEQKRTPADISRWLLDVCNIIIANSAQIDDLKFEVEYLSTIRGCISTLNDCMSMLYADMDDKDVDLYFRILNNTLRTQSVPFEGEPLTGLQVLGFMETRCLDFERIIMLSVNESIFPKKSDIQSMIPYSMRKGFGLPTIENRDSIFAYYFYRLLQRANQVKILYSTQVTDKSAEPSRFITQLKYELPNKLTFNNIGFQIAKMSRSNLVGKKDVSKVKILFQKGIYPSDINNYLSCPFRFYLHNIEHVDEPQRFQDPDRADTFGQLFHGIMKYLYRDFVDEEVCDLMIDAVGDDYTFEKAAKAAIRDVYRLGDSDDKMVNRIYGRNIIFDILREYVRQQLKYDRKNSPFVLLKLEQYFERIIDIVPDGATTPMLVRLCGRVDRLDVRLDLDGIHRVVDYKSGRTESNSDITLERLFLPNADSVKHLYMQLLIYSILVKEAYPNEVVCPCIFNVNQLSLDDFDYRLKMPNTFDGDEFVYDSFIKELKQLLRQIADENIDYIPTDDEKACTYCPYKNLCFK